MTPVRLSIDVCGGDHGPAIIIEGVVDACRCMPGEFTARLCGDNNVIRSVLKQYDVNPDDGSGSFSVEQCLETVSSDDTPSRVWKTKPDSSIIRCLSLQRDKTVDASLSAGDTGILMSGAVFLLGLNPQVRRPALAAVLPSTAGNPVLVLDVGANLNCRADDLISFVTMGRQYMTAYYGVAVPRVALLNIGKERSKGTAAITEANEKLTGECPGYTGFIEGSRVLAGDADIVACDGFAGNVLLKACESFFVLTESVLGKNDPELLSSIRRSMTIFNPENYGGAPFLGINGIVLKAHGSSSARAISRAVTVAVRAVQRQVVTCDVSEDAKGRLHSYAA